MTPINEWGGLYRTPYFVVPRIALEAMPDDWQRKFTALMDEAHEKHGISTPEYHVLRADPSYTSVELNDPDDPGSWPREFYIQCSDPWANYRHGNIKELCPDYKENPA